MVGFPSDNEIRTLIDEKIGSDSDVGLVVGLIEPHGQRVIAHGYADNEKMHAIDGGTIFELGSVTKVFTALLLADMVKRGEVKLDDPVSKYVPKGEIFPGQSGHPIPLVDLATSSSGATWNLPELSTPHVTLPPAGKDSSRLGPDAFGEPSLAAYANHQVADVGFGILAYALSKRKKSNFQQLLGTVILRPLALDDTGVGHRSTVVAGRLAQGHDATMHPVLASTQLNVFVGSEGLKSSANDLLKFLAAVLEQKFTRFAFSVRESLSVRRATRNADTLAAMGWIIQQRDGRELVWRGGDQGGFSTWIGFDAASKRAAVVLANTEGDLARYLGFQLFDLPEFLRQSHPHISVPGDRLDSFAGRYKLLDGQIVTIVRENDHLTLNLDPFGPAPALPVGDRAFSTPAQSLQFTFDFESEKQERPKRVVFYQNDTIEVAERIE
ncbi:MAG: beta-lactamase family protein [Rhodospirillaceae bacterium]|nr:beta-lactamase family protein [Rhodospirillaceae bacterium]